MVTLQVNDTVELKLYVAVNCRHIVNVISIYATS